MDRRTFLGAVGVATFTPYQFAQAVPPVVPQKLLEDRDSLIDLGLELQRRADELRIRLKMELRKLTYPPKKKDILLKATIIGDKAPFGYYVTLAYPKEQQEPGGFIGGAESLEEANEIKIINCCLKFIDVVKSCEKNTTSQKRALLMSAKWNVGRLPPPW